ncbi:MAG: hypothetical protein LAO56_01750 [Acidobacteriia bacterium]|nr:hypothetical protein [Terriglobia bacterium]
MKRGCLKRVLLLSGCLLAFAASSTAQIGFLTAVSRTSKAATPVSEVAPNEPAPEPITLPTGTHVLMKLISPLHTTSSTPGSGVYLETAFPVVANGRVAIPERTRVLGVVADERRPGRVQGRAQLQLRFTQLVLPDNRTLSIVGGLQSLPGSSANRTVDKEGTLEPVDQIDADVYTMAGATGVGLLGGAMSLSRNGLRNGFLIGAGLGLAKVLFTRGNEISLPVGTRIEMVLHHPLTVQPESALAVAVNRIPDPPRDGGPTFPPARYKANSSADKIPCLRDGVTLQCVTPETVTASQVEPARDR